MIGQRADAAGHERTCEAPPSIWGDIKNYLLGLSARNIGKNFQFRSLFLENKDKKTKIEIIRIILDALVLIIMAFTLNSAWTANRIAKQSILASRVPWLSITGIEPTLDKNILRVAYVLKNHSDAPALNVHVYCGGEGIAEAGTSSYDQDAVMPKRDSVMNFNFVGNSAAEAYNKLEKGNMSLIFTINYSDMFDRPYKLIQEVKKINNTFRNIHIEIKGPDDPL